MIINHLMGLAIMAILIEEAITTTLRVRKLSKLEQLFTQRKEETEARLIPDGRSGSPTDSKSEAYGLQLIDNKSISDRTDEGLSTFLTSSKVAEKPKLFNIKELKNG